MTTLSMVWKTDTWYEIECGCWISSTCPSRATPSFSTSLCALSPLPSSSDWTVLRETLQGDAEGGPEKSQGISSLGSLITKLVSWRPQILSLGPLYISFSSHTGTCLSSSPSCLALGHWTILLFLNPTHTSVIHWVCHQSPTRILPKTLT